MNPLYVLPDRERFAAEDLALAPGDCVRICVKIAKHKRGPGDGVWEPVWVEITSVDGIWPRVTYHGVVQKQADDVDLDVGAPVELYPWNVCDVTHRSVPRSPPKRKFLPKPVVVRRSE
jgi:hypothetical protein